MSFVYERNPIVGLTSPADGAGQNAPLAAGPGGRVIRGTAGDDILRGSDGDRIEGGDGYDIAVFDGNADDWELEGDGGDLTLHGASGSVTLASDVEALQFDDILIELVSDMSGGHRKHPASRYRQIFPTVIQS